ncbi:hypothetical protein ES708_21426 [subsurface metagenome]
MGILAKRLAAKVHSPDVQDDRRCRQYGYFENKAARDGKYPTGAVTSATRTRVCQQGGNRGLNEQKKWTF